MKSTLTWWHVMMMAKKAANPAKPCAPVVSKNKNWSETCLVTLLAVFLVSFRMVCGASNKGSMEACPSIRENKKATLKNARPGWPQFAMIHAIRLANEPQFLVFRGRSSAGWFHCNVFVCRVIFCPFTWWEAIWGLNPKLEISWGNGMVSSSLQNLRSSKGRVCRPVKVTNRPLINHNLKFTLRCSHGALHPVQPFGPCINR